MSNKKTALVTGASGFIGSNLVKDLLNNGFTIKAFVLPDENLAHLKDLDIEILTGDLTKLNEMKTPLPDVEYVFHLAAIMGVGKKSVEFLNQVNINGSKNIINHYLKYGNRLKKFIFVSSIAAAGPSGISGKLTEDSESNPETAYGKSKLKIEKYLFELKERFPYTIVRLPLVYGPGSIRGLYVMFKMINKGIQFTNVNNRFNVGYVKDITKGMMLAAESDIALNNIYYLGENKIYTSSQVMAHIADTIGKKVLKLNLPYWALYSINYIVEKTCDIFRINPPVRRDSLRSYFKSNWCISVNKAETDLNYKTDYPLEKGIEITADWYKEHGYI